MHIEKFESEVKRAWNKPLTSLKLKDGSTNTQTIINVEGTYEAYGVDKDEKAYLDADWEAAYDEMTAKNDLPTKQEIVQMRNAKRLATAKANATAKELVNAGFVQPTPENDDQLRLKRAFDLFYSAIPADVRKADPEAARLQARAEASKAFNIQWEDE